MYQERKYRIKGIVPLMMHNGQLANPFNEFAKRIKVITNKGRGKTDEDLVQLAELEWEGGLYLDAQGKPCVPGEAIERTLLNGAMKSSNGPKFKAGAMCEGDWPLEYEGPKSLEALRADQNFRLVKMETVNRAKVLRTRPKFNNWELEFVMLLNPTVFNARDLDRAVMNAGRLIGLLEKRPRYGCFEILEIEGEAIDSAEYFKEANGKKKNGS